MSEFPQITATEQTIYRQYERQRRLDLTRGIAPVFAVILLSFLVIVDIEAPKLPSTLFQQDKVERGLLIGDPFLTLCVALLIFAAIAARRGKVGAATLSTIIATNVSVITIELMWNFGLSGFDFVAAAALAALSLAVVLAGVVGERWMVIATAVLMNLVTISLGLWSAAPHPTTDTNASIAALLASQQFIVVSGALLLQWAFASVMLNAGSAYQRIMNDLGNVRVAFERARQLDELKNQFISSINHEIRRPVMAMQGYLELLQLMEDNITPEKRKALLLRATTAGDNLVTLLSSILDARRLDKDADDFTPEVVSVRAAVNTAVELIDPRAGVQVERELRLSIPTGMVIWGETVRLQQILINLLSNALKYSDPGAPVEITARFLTENATGSNGIFSRANKKVEHRMAELIIRDYGFGIPPDQVPLLFQRFVRLQRDLASPILGNGLGLHLCKVLTEAMGGRSWVESSGVHGEGSTFHIVLPVPTVEQIAKQAATPTPTEAADKYPLASL